MAHIQLGLVLHDLTQDINQANRLVDASIRWHNRGSINGLPQFTLNYVDLVVEMAYLKSFLAWEEFLQESFVLYLLGKVSPSGYRPTCCISPRNRNHALDITRNGRSYADWTAVNSIVDRAGIFFNRGEPFSNSLRPKTNLFDEMKTIRNALAHNTDETNTRFASLVRRRLGHFPPRLTPGRFLSMIIPGSVPPNRYLSFYTSELLLTAGQIVP